MVRRPRWLEDSEGALLYGDDPLHSLQLDLLDRGRLADQLARAIVSVANQSPSAVVALVGPWGSGKTTLLAAIENKLKTNGWSLARHNPWSYSSYEAAVAGFFSELRAALPPNGIDKDLRGTIGNWVTRIAPLGAAGGLVGVDASGVIFGIGDLISGDRSPEALRDSAATALKKLPNPVLVVLDDLDRLQPPELLLTFKLVRLLGRLPNVYYLLAYDEETLTDVLKRTDLVSDGHGRAQQYLEKMVQVRLDIPPLLEEQKAQMVNKGIDDLCARHEVELSVDGNERLQQAWNECLAAYLDQPRAIKRLFTQVDALLPDVSDEVDFVDFVLVTFLRTFEQRVFDLMVESREELLGGSDYVGGSETNQDRWRRWTDGIAKLDARYPVKLTILLSELFLPLRAARANVLYSNHSFDDVRRRYGVGSAEFFDRYVQVGVPTSDLSERLVGAAVLEMREGKPGDALADLRSWLDTDAAMVVRKLERIEDTDPLPREATLILLGDHYEAAISQGAGHIGSPDFGVLMLAIKIISRSHPSVGRRLVEAVANSGPSGLTLAAELAKREMLSDEPTAAHMDISAATPHVTEALVRRVRDAAQQPIEENGRAVRDCDALFHLLGKEGIRGLLWELLNGETSWTLADFLAAMVPIGPSTDGRGSWPSMGELSIGSVDDLLGLSQTIEALPPDLPPPEYGPPFQRGQANITFETRRRYALGEISKWRSGLRLMEGPDREGVSKPPIESEGNQNA